MSAAEVAPRPGPLRTESTLVYRTGRWLTHLFLLALGAYRVEGRAHVPARGPAVLVGNHTSYLDIPLVANAAKPRHVAFVARDSLARSRFLAFVMDRSGAVLVRRGEPDRVAVREMLAHLAAGDLVAVFPEGTRSPDGTVRPFRGGALLAARRTGAPLVPVGIVGAFRALPRGKTLPRPARIRVRFGAPLAPDVPLDELRHRVAELAGVPVARDPAARGAGPRPASSAPEEPT